MLKFTLQSLLWIMIDRQSIGKTGSFLLEHIQLEQHTTSGYHAFLHNAWFVLCFSIRGVVLWYLLKKLRK